MTDDAWPPLYPVLATWKEGRRLVGRDSAPAEELWAQGTPPVWGLAVKPASELRLLASVRVDDELAVGTEGARLGRA